MSLTSAAKALMERAGIGIKFHRSSQAISLEISRLSRERRQTPPLFDDPIEAVHFARGGKSCAFNCPVDLCVSVNGLGFARDGWHPFSATLADRSTTASRSLLEQFYERWQPRTAQEALLDPIVAPPLFAELPPHFIYWFPWSARTRCEADRAVRRWTDDDNIEHKGPRLKSFKTDGLKDHGPVSLEVSAFEHRRLSDLLDSLSRHGYQRSRGDINVLILKRGKELRYLNFGGGLHRTAVMRALNHSHIPARPLGQQIIDIDEVHYWPQVRNGIWSRRQAMRYMDHLFDFDSLGWARSMGLASAEVVAAPDLSGGHGAVYR